MLKNIIIVVGLVGLIWFMWYETGNQHKKEFKNNLPEEIEETPLVSFDEPASLKEDVNLVNVPLISNDDFQLNKNFSNELAQLYDEFFNKEKLMLLKPGQIEQSKLVLYNASTIIQLRQFIFNENLENLNTKINALNFLGSILKREKERIFFINNYLISEGYWRPTMKNIHFMLMKLPENKVLNEAFINMLKFADTDLVLDYMRDVQFLERHPRDEYFSVNRQVMVRFNTKTLKILLDKVDDYSWYAAYPEKDAADGLREILKQRSE